jgi:hypothetical protein
MAKNRTPPKFEARNERDLLRAAKKALPEEFPNPERLGCPDPSTLQAIAVHELSTPDIDDWVDHIATCSQCFAAYNAYRNAYTSRRNRRRVGALVAAFAVLLASWLLGRKVLFPTEHHPEQIAESTPRTAILDFRNRTSDRSVQDSPKVPPEIPHLSQSLLNVQIRLPLGTEDGQYSLEFRNSGGGIAVRTTGTAVWDGTNETLSARIDLRAIEPGRYTLAIRKGAESWRQYSIIVDP